MWGTLVPDPFPLLGKKDGTKHCGIPERWSTTDHRPLTLNYALGDDQALESLRAFFVAFFDLHVHAHSVTCLEIRKVGAARLG